MSKWKRVLLSFASTLSATTVMALVMALATGRQQHWYTAIWAWAWVFNIFAFPGFLVAIPFVLLLEKLHHPKFWIIATIGVLIGPTTISLLGSLAWLFGRDAFLFAPSFFAFATFTSLLATTFYLVFTGSGKETASEAVAAS